MLPSCCSKFIMLTALQNQQFCSHTCISMFCMCIHKHIQCTQDTQWQQNLTNWLSTHHCSQAVDQTNQRETCFIHVNTIHQCTPCLSTTTNTKALSKQAKRKGEVSAHVAVQSDVALCSSEWSPREKRTHFILTRSTHTLQPFRPHRDKNVVQTNFFPWTKRRSLGEVQKTCSSKNN